MIKGLIFFLLLLHALSIRASDCEIRDVHNFKDESSITIDVGGNSLVLSYESISKSRLLLSVKEDGNAKRSVNFLDVLSGDSHSGSPGGIMVSNLNDDDDDDFVVYYVYGESGFPLYDYQLYIGGEQPTKVKSGSSYSKYFFREMDGKCVFVEAKSIPVGLQNDEYSEKIGFPIAYHYEGDLFKERLFSKNELKNYVSILNQIENVYVSKDESDLIQLEIIRSHRDKAESLMNER